MGARNAWKLALAAAVIFLTACNASTINPDAPQRANATLANIERGMPSPYGDHDKQEARLWRDKPEYAALPGAKHKVEIRMVSAVAPNYPIMLRFNRVEADVIVSFVVGLDGRVEDARIMESSDSRFDASALEAMRQFTFLPAEGASGPERSMKEQPFHFQIRKRAGTANPS